ncbi:hypothetical protein [Pedobacter steynii]
MKYFNLLTLIFLVLITKAQTTDQPKADALVPKHVQKWLTEKTAFKKRKATKKASSYGIPLKSLVTSKGMIKLNIPAASSTMRITLLGKIYQLQ